MGQRLSLQTLLETLTPNVYFQPPPNVSMLYPCIRYELNDMDTLFAGNVPYRMIDRYKVTVIDKDPDSGIRKSVANLPMCSFDRFYTASNLNHFVFTLYF